MSDLTTLSTEKLVAQRAEMDAALRGAAAMGAALPDEVGQALAALDEEIARRGASVAPAHDPLGVSELVSG